MTEARQKLFAGMAIAGLALLLMANLLLLQIVQDDDGEKTAVKRGAVVKDGEDLPALPAPSKKGTSRALLRELDKTRKDLSKPVNRALDQLDAIGASSADLALITPLMQQLVVQSAELSEAVPALQQSAKRLKRLDKQFQKVGQSIENIAPVMVDLERTMQQMAADIDRIRVCTESPSSC